MFKHTCHARNCNVEVKPELLMCLKHWRLVPMRLQREVWKYYRPGQADDKKPSIEWTKAATAAIEAVYEREQAQCQSQPNKTNKSGS